MSLYLRMYKYLVKEVYWWNVVYCMGAWEVVFNIWFLRIFIWFLSGAKVWIKKSFLIENLKMDTGQFFWLICGYCCETVCKSSVLVKFVPFGCVLSKFPSYEYWVKKVRILTKKATQIRVSQIRVSQIRATQIRASQIRATEISSNHRELHGAIFDRGTLGWGLSTGQDHKEGCFYLCLLEMYPSGSAAHHNCCVLVQNVLENWRQGNPTTEISRHSGNPINLKSNLQISGDNLTQGHVLNESHQ